MYNLKKRLVSIIIPLYNAEKYIGNCIESLLNQTYQYIEIIIVNDGSTDNSEKICLSYSDSRIRYVKQINKGEGGARNTGLNIAFGEYVVFCDSDDYLPIDAIENHLNIIKDTELSIGGMKKKKDNIFKEYIPSNKIILTKSEIVSYLLKESYFINPICSKMFKNDIIKKNNIVFSDFKYGADTEFIYKYLYYINRVVFFGKIVYCINVVEGSMSLRKISNSWIYMSNIYLLGKKLSIHNDLIRHRLLLRSIKTSLLLDNNNSREIFQKSCEIMHDFLLEEEPIQKNYNDAIYDKIIYFLLKTASYKNLYYFIKFRKYLDYRL